MDSKGITRAGRTSVIGFRFHSKTKKMFTMEERDQFSLIVLEIYFNIKPLAGKSNYCRWYESNYNNVMAGLFI